jgi:hypothetical protein
MRNSFRDGFGFGNKYDQAAAGGDPATLYLNDFVFAWDHAKMPYVFLETSTQSGAINDGIKHMIRARVTPAEWVRGLDPGGNGHGYVAVTVLTDLRQYTQVNGNVAYSVPTLDQMNAANVWADKDLIMYIPGYQFYETHVNADPFAAIMADSNAWAPSSRASSASVSTSAPRF